MYQKTITTYCLEDGNPVPEPMISIDDAIAYHIEALAKADKESLAEYGEGLATISTTFRIVEIEVPALQLATV